MKFSCGKKDMVNAIAKVQKAIAKKSTYPILEGVLLKTNGDNLEVYGFDLELGVKVTIDVDCTEEGSIVLDCKVFGNIVKSLPNAQVEIEADNNFVACVKSGKSKFSIKGVDPQKYPTFPVLNETEMFSVPQKTLKSMIKQTIFAVSQSDVKPIYTGSMFQVSKNNFKIMSIDGCRMAMREENIAINIDNDKSVVVPSKALNEVLKFTKYKDDEVKIAFDNTYITFEFDNYYIISRLLQGEFIDYRTVIPKETVMNVLVSTEDFNDSVKRFVPLIVDKFKYPIKCVFDRDNVKMSCETPIGKAEDEIEASADTDTKIEMGFNEKYLQDAFDNIDIDEVKISVKNSFCPIVITPTDNSSFLFLVLPVKLKK